MRFMATEDNVTSSVFITFLKRLMAGAAQPIFLIVDNHSVHRSAEVRDFVKSTRGRLRLFYLLPYAPELNPDEHVGIILKIKNWPSNKRIDSVMRSLQKLPAKIRSFFRHPMTKYTLMFGNQCTD